MILSYRFTWLAALSIILPLLFFFGIISIFWWFLTPGEAALLTNVFQDRLIYFVGILGLLVLCFGLILSRLVYHQIFPAIRLTEDAELIRAGNPAHRIQPMGSPSLQKLAAIINEWATRLESDQNNIESMITEAKSQSETEKNILAEFLAQLPEGVMVCNLKGKISLYNKQAKRFLAGDPKNALSKEDDASDSYKYIGLGRWVTDVVDPHLIRHAIDEIKVKLKKKQSDIAAYFVFSQHHRMFRVEAVPILDHLRELTGYTLIFYNITKEMQTDGRGQFLWQTFTRQVRSTMTSIRSAVETLLEYPELPIDRKKRLKQLIHKESVNLGDILDDTMAEYNSCCSGNRWPLMFIKDLELIEIIKNRTAEKFDIELTLKQDQSKGWVRVDTYSISLAVVFMINQLKETISRKQFDIRLKRTGQFIALDILWMGRPIKIEQLKKWENQPVTIGKESVPFTLKEIMGYHHMDIVSYPGRKETDLSHIRFFMPAFEAPEPIRKRNMAILPESRPEFFDFDLFHQLGQHPDLDAKRLDDLTFTVFDMETTGLDINGGDRVVSIGAVRIVNGKLLKDEQFDQLIDPGIPIPKASTTFHGITDDMVAGCPSVEDTLPRFYDFSDETVLVAHNAAFDMRLLQIHERFTGIKFVNPVLDTLLLSAVVHPSSSNHHLEAIAKRLGVRLHNRHSAMGDALTTATIFLKLLSLLAERGIVTMKDARKASQQTYYARLKY